MKAIQFIAVTAALAGGAALADTAKIKNPGNNHYYQRFDKTRGWHDAKAYCSQLGGYLATVTTQIEQNFVWNQFGNTNTSTQGIWLGASDETQEGRWVWSTGELWNYSNWEQVTPSPDNAGSYGQHYLMLYTNSPDWVQAIISFWGDMSSINSAAGAGNNSAHTVSTLCEWNTLPDVYGQFSLVKTGVKGAKVTLKQTGQPDKTVQTDKKGNYQLKRNNTSIPSTLQITLPAGP